jgi:hypothetical protein
MLGTREKSWEDCYKFQDLFNIVMAEIGIGRKRITENQDEIRNTWSLPRFDRLRATWRSTWMDLIVRVIWSHMERLRGL